MQYICRPVIGISAESIDGLTGIYLTVQLVQSKANQAEHLKLWNFQMSIAKLDMLSSVFTKISNI